MNSGRSFFDALPAYPGGKHKLLPQILCRARPGTPSLLSGLLPSQVGVPGRAPIVLLVRG